jgi:hypothetical protein
MAGPGLALRSAMAHRVAGGHHHGKAALVFGRLTVADLKQLFASLSLNTLIGAAMGFCFGRLTK